MDDDTVHYGQMQKAPNRGKFELDMQWEIKNLLASQSITISLRKDMPKDSKAVQAIWSFHRKRAPDWSITNWKARLCPHAVNRLRG
jgi:hypothetical protein